MVYRAAILLLVVPFALTATPANEENVGNSVNRPSRSVFDLGLRLQKAILGEGNPENVIISPTSVVGVMALSLLGSVGKTYDELVQSLGFATDVTINQNHHRFFGEQLSRLNSANISSKTLYANAIFVEQSTHIRKMYKDFLQGVYRADIINVDFSGGNRTLEIINEWVSSHTAGRIPTLLRSPPAPGARLVLTSALYFSGAWLIQFVPRYTRRMPFLVDPLDPSKNVEMDSMLSIDKYRHTLSFEHDCQLLAVPYVDNVTTLYILKPWKPKRTSLKKLLDAMDAEKIEKLIADATLQNVVFRLPKMNLRSRTDLRDPLSQLGIKSLFSPTDANLALMVDGSGRRDEDELTARIGEEARDKRAREMLAALPNPGLHVDSVLHEVAITIDEKGTEAAAATAGLVAKSAVTFNVDSPFFFFIRNEPTGLVTFSAAVFNPTQ